MEKNKFKNSETLINIEITEVDGTITHSILTPVSTYFIDKKATLNFNPNYDDEKGYETLYIDHDEPILKIPKQVADELYETIMRCIMMGTSDFYHYVLTSREFYSDFRYWLSKDENNMDIILAYINPLTRDLIEVIE